MPSRLPFEPLPLYVIEGILARKVVDENGCWNWPGATNHGYGRVQHEGRFQYVHRQIYGWLVGQLEPPYVIDHLCRNRRCFNPAHLEAVTDGDNHRRGARVALKTTCAKGHPWIPENWYVRANGTRWCRECRKVYFAAHRDEINARRRAQAAAKRAAA